MTHRLTSSLLLSTIIVLLFLCTIVYSAALYDGATSNVTVLTARDVHVLTSGETWLVNICPDERTICQEFEPVYEQVASSLKGKINVGVVSDEHFVKTEKATSLPSVRLYSGFQKPFVLIGKRDADSILRFAKDLSAGLYGGKTTNVRVLSGNDLRLEMMARNETWLVNFCPSEKRVCQDFEPVYEEVASSLKDKINVGVVLDERDAKDLGATRFPTVKLYRGFGKKPITCHKKRETENLLRFVQKYSAGLKGDKTSHVRMLTAENFDSKLLDNKNWLVNFCPDGQAICKEFDPVYERVAFLLKKRIYVGRVIDERLAKDKKVTSFPTVKFYRRSGNKKPVTFRFNGFRDTTTLLRFVEQSLNDLYAGKSSHVKVLTGKDFQSKVVDTKESWIINFCPKEKTICHEAEPIYERTAFFLKEKINVGAVIDESVFPENVEFAGSPTVLLYRGAGKEPITYYGYLDTASLRHFFDRSVGELYGGRRSYVTMLTAEGFQGQVVDCKANWLINFCPDDLAICHEFVPEYEGAASLVKNKVKVGAVVDERLAKKQKVTIFPTVELYLCGLEEPIRYKGLGKNEKSLSASIRDFVSSQLEKFSKENV